MNKCYQVLLNVIKNIFCIQEYNDNCNKCSLCHLIDINSLPSLKVIEPIDSIIKKEQIIELKNLFAKESQYTKESIYIIKEAEKMNKESANTMLKFLEEPEGNVIGFFITNNIENILPTIQSRTQHIEVLYSNTDYEDLGLDNEEYTKYLKLTLDYIEKVEIEKKDLILYNKECLDELEKTQIIIVLKIMLNIYKDTLESSILNKKIKYEFLKHLNKNNLNKKVNLIINTLKKISYNVNVDLLMDSFVLEMEAINNEVI